VAIAVASAAKLSGQRKPDLSVGGFDLCSSKVLLDVDVGAPF
jgi:hypothetical protein